MNRACRVSSCHGIVRSGVCGYCGRSSQVRSQDRRPPAARRGYDSRWRKIRAVVLASESLCRQCIERGSIKSADLVDHIIPLRGGGTHGIANLQPLCRSCHAEKTASDNAAGGTP